MRLKSNGRLGIGTSDPSGKFHIDHGDTYNQGLLHEYVSTYVTRTKFGRPGTSSNLELYYDIAGTEVAKITRNYSSAQLQFDRAGTVDMIINGSGLVGIGTTSPGVKLHVAGGDIFTDGQFRLNQGQGITWNNGDNYIKGISGYHLQFTTYDGASAQQEVLRLTGGTSTSGGGRLGVGVTSPDAKLDVNGNALFRVAGSATTTGDFTIANDACSRTVGPWALSSTPIFFINSENTDSPHIGLNMSTNTGDGPKIIGYKSRGSAAANSSVLNGDDILSIQAWPLHTAGPNIYKFGGGMTWYKDDGGGTANTYAPVSLKWVMSNSTTTTITAMTLTYNGNLSTYGTITAGGDVYAYSDARVKENVETIDNALDKVMSMRGVSYNRIDTEDKTKKVGVIAQEIQNVLPVVVTEQEDGMLSVSYGNIVGVLIEAIKEQQKQIDELKALLNGSTK